MRGIRVGDLPSIAQQDGESFVRMNIGFVEAVVTLKFEDLPLGQGRYDAVCRFVKYILFEIYSLGTCHFNKITQKTQNAAGCMEFGGAGANMDRDRFSERLPG